MRPEVKMQMRWIFGVLGHRKEIGKRVVGHGKGGGITFECFWCAH